MIPQQIPITPLIVILALVGAAFAWAALRAGLYAARGRLEGRWVLWTEKNPATVTPEGVPAPRQLTVSWRSLGFGIAAVSGLLAMGCALVAAGVQISYPRMYERSVWAALDSGYGIHAAIPEQGFEPGVPFSALRDGQAIECSVTPPSTVACGSELLRPRK